MLDYLLRPSTLKDWAGLTLDQRAVRLHRVFTNVKITGSYIGQIYSKNKIRRKKINIKKFSNAKTEIKIKAKVEENRELIKGHIASKESIYYLDECMFTVKTHSTLEYAAKYQNVEVGASEYNIKSTAFIGVVSLNKGIFCYELFDRSVNKERFVFFLKKLRKKHGEGKIILYQDNLKVHLSNLAKDCYKDLNIVPLYAPVYSPQYNPIEFCFSKLKGIVKKMRLNDMMTKRKRTYRQLVPLAVQKITIEDVDNCIRHVHRIYGL